MRKAWYFFSSLVIAILIVLPLRICNIAEKKDSFVKLKQQKTPSHDDLLCRYYCNPAAEVRVAQHDRKKEGRKPEIKFMGPDIKPVDRVKEALASATFSTTPGKTADSIKPKDTLKSNLTLIKEKQANVKETGYKSLSATAGNYPLSPPPPRQKTEWDEIGEGILSSFSLPFSDLLKKKHSSEWDNLSDGLAVSFAFITPLKKKAPAGNAGMNVQTEQITNACFTASLKYNPLSYWFVNVTAYLYLNQSLQEAWNPDFTYVFGYDDWHPYTFSLIYSNYGGNRFIPEKSKNEQFTRFEEGTFTLGWKFPAAKFIEDLTKVHSSGGLSHSINYNLTPSYLDLASNSMKSWKQTLSLSTRYTIYKWFYLNFVLYYYFDPESKQPWNPDFTYGFGYFNWHPGTFSVQYNNYSGNRFPWNKKNANTGSFLDGSISISWSWVF